MSNLEKALELARKIPPGKKSKRKSKAVHAWVIAIKEMIKNGR